MTKIFPIPFKYSLLAEQLARKPWLLVIVCSTVLFLGFALSLGGFCSAFGRSGSVLVAVSLCFVYVNHYLSKELNQKTKIREKNNHLLSYETAKAAFKRGNSNLSEEKAHELAINTIAALTHNKQAIPELEKVSARVTATEFAAGIIGTLVWGFGDMPFECVA